MKRTVEEMEAQLRVWGVKIDQLAEATAKAGTKAGFEAQIYIDELRALHVIAQTQLERLLNAKDGERSRLESEMTTAWNDLTAAFRKPAP